MKNEKNELEHFLRQRLGQLLAERGGEETLVALRQRAHLLAFGLQSGLSLLLALLERILVTAQKHTERQIVRQDRVLAQTIHEALKVALTLVQKA
jgi:hypothetical protein